MIITNLENTMHYIFTAWQNVNRNVIFLKPALVFYDNNIIPLLMNKREQLRSHSQAGIFTCFIEYFP